MFQQGTSLTFFGSNNTVLTTTGDKLVFGPTVPSIILRWGVVVTTTFNLVQLIMALDKTPTLLGAGGRVNAWGGTITATTAIAAGVGLYNDLGSLTTEQRIILPGEGVVIECTDQADTAGAGLPFIEYRPLSFSTASVAAKMTRVTA